MLRITQVQLERDSPGNGASLRLEGALHSESVATLLAACEALLAASSASSCVVLDVADVRFVDPAGATALRDLQSRGALIVGCSPLVSSLLELRPSMNAHRSPRDRRTQSPGASSALLDNDSPDAAAVRADQGGSSPDAQSGEMALLQRLRAGDSAAFEQVVQTHTPRMLAVARRLVRCDSDAADAVQDAFLSAYRSLDRFEGGSSLSTWLHRIVVNAALMKLRSAKRRSELSIESMLPSFDHEGHRRNARMGWQQPAESLLQRQETRRLIRDRIDMLPEDYRTVIMLRDIEELDTEATAEALGITPGAVKTRLHRARMALRELLTGEIA